MRREHFTFDRAGNRTQQSIALNGGAPTVTNYTYNAGNQMTNAGAATLTYDNNGNLLNDGTNEYTWDRANRLSFQNLVGVSSGTSHQYDGNGNRVWQSYTNGIQTTITRYVLDMQPGLALVLSADQNKVWLGQITTDRYLHAARGIHAQQLNGGAWQHPLHDGLGSVRSVTDAGAGVLYATSYTGYGMPDAVVGTPQIPYGFTGELYNSTTDMLYLRARHYRPSLGIFTSLDPFEGIAGRPMSLNGYSWVEGNVVNAVDPSGMILERPEKWHDCKMESQAQCEDFPGWFDASIYAPNLRGYCGHNSGRTLHPDLTRAETPQQLQNWWLSLSSTERQIEFALSATAAPPCNTNAPFHHHERHTYAFVMGWIMSNQHLIRSISSEIRIKPAMVAGTLASEMLFDYGWTDEWSDATLLWSPNGGYGYANAHASARESAANYLLPLFGEGQVGVIPQSVVGREADVARWLTTAEGAIYASAIVGRWLVDAFTSNIGVGYERALSLSAQEMAVIWAGYRAGVGGMDANIPSTSVGFENVDEWRDTARSSTLPCNAQIALPLMERMNIIFS